MIIRPYAEADFDAMLSVAKAAAQAYAGVIRADRYHVPHTPAGELRGVMGIQDSGDVTLIRHAYILPEHQGKGIGGRLVAHLMGRRSGRCSSGPGPTPPGRPASTILMLGGRSH